MRQRGGDGQPGGVTQGPGAVVRRGRVPAPLGPAGGRLSDVGDEPAPTQGLGLREVETEKVAAVVGHRNILTFIGLRAASAAGRRRGGMSERGTQGSPSRAGERPATELGSPYQRAAAAHDAPRWWTRQ